MLYATNSFQENKSGDDHKAPPLAQQNPQQKSKMKQYIVLSLLITAAIPVANASPIPSPLDEFSRKSKTEIYGTGEYLTSWETTKFDHGNVSLKIDSGFGGGIGFGGNVTDYLNVNTSLTGAAMDFEARDSFFGNSSGDPAVVKWDVSLDYNILKTRFTPLLTAGAGVAYFSGNFNNSFLGDFGETDFVWGVGAGVRWDISEHWFAKATYRVSWTSLQDSDNPTRFNSISLGIGYVF
jgi:opacity protein-like surface antigen